MKKSRKLKAILGLATVGLISTGAFLSYQATNSSETNIVRMSGAARTVSGVEKIVIDLPNSNNGSYLVGSKIKATYSIVMEPGVTEEPEVLSAHWILTLTDGTKIEAEGDIFEIHIQNERDYDGAQIDLSLELNTYYHDIPPVEPAVISVHDTKHLTLSHSSSVFLWSAIIFILLLCLVCTWIGIVALRYRNEHCSERDIF